MWGHACGDGAVEPAGPTQPPDPLRPTTLTVTPATAELAARGATVQLTAEVRDQNGQVIAGATVAWTSSDASIATVSPSGLVTATASGATTITARAGSAFGTAEITIKDSDRAALVALYEATDGPNWVNSENWLTDAPLRAWYGVSVDQSGRVVKLDLSGQYDSTNRQWGEHGLKGPIPPELGNLASIEHLNLTSNTLSGPIPPELGNLTNLRLLNLASNNLSGPIPPKLGSLFSLEYLDLSYNRLSSLPTAIGNLSVHSLKIQYNNLSGPIPSSLGNIGNLETLVLGNNRLSGPIPPELGNLTKLEWLFLDSNELSGPIPPELGNLTKLEWLSLVKNQLSGPIPPELGNLTNLTRLYLGETALSDPIPLSLLQLARLERLWVGDSNLCVPRTPPFAAWLQGLDWNDSDKLPDCNAGDLAALKSLYAAAGGTGWTRSDGWLGMGWIDEWYGVTADSLGRVVGLDLGRNGLTGRLPANLGSLDRMNELQIGDNALSGPLPLSLTRVPLRQLHYADTDLCAPSGASFQKWLDAIPSHQGTGVECAPLPDRDALVALYEATNGSNWADRQGWLTDAPVGEWHGIDVDGAGKVVKLDLAANRLSGAIPPELGNLSNLTNLSFGGNDLSGPIPPELGGLSSLTNLSLSWNDLSGPIPPELGNLSNLTNLSLGGNDLSGPIPPELGNLSNLTNLSLDQNALSGAIPPELGDLSSLTNLSLDWNDLSGSIPPTVGNLVNLTHLYLRSNDLSGPIPPELGDLSRVRFLQLNDNTLTGPVPYQLGGLSFVEELYLDNNDLSGPVPPEFGAMSNLRALRLANNPGMAGPLPAAVMDLRHLNELMAGRTDLCVPRDPGFQAWLEGIAERWISSCADAVSSAYLTQAIQSQEFPVPMVAGERALLRVFLTSNTANGVDIPPVRARFYRNGRETHVEDIPGKSVPIPTAIVEGDLSSSSNARVPGHVIQPGLEMVIEVDPEGTLDPALGVAKRIPEEGRLPVDVRPVPLFELTLVPFVTGEPRDSSMVDLAKAVAANPENHDLLWATRDLLPVADLDVKSHEPVLTSSSNPSGMLRETIAIRAMESGSGHWMGIFPFSFSVAGGIAQLSGWSSASTPRPGTVAHELGHNLSLQHAPCGTVGDPLFPHADGLIGAWGYDFRGDGELVSPDTPALMSYCGPRWISDYHFLKALRFRLSKAGSAVSTAVAPSRVSALLLWGGTDAEGVPFLEPAFAVDALPELPQFGGDHRITGRTTGGTELFSLTFDMPEVAGDDSGSSFAFVLPVRSGWQGSLAAITLTGPGGSFTLDGDSNLPMAILRNPQTRQVRASLAKVRPHLQIMA